MGVAWTTPAACAIVRESSSPRNSRDRLVGEVGAHAGGEILRARGVDIEQVESLRTARQERVGGRRARPTAPELHDALERRGREGPW